MKNKRRKAYQCKLNKEIKMVNKGIESDSLWKGRFKFFQRESHYENFEDNSGGILYATIRGYDKKTGYYKDFRIEYAPYFSLFTGKLWWIINDFIVNDCCVWEQEQDPKKDTTNYINIGNDVEKMSRKKSNFFLTYKNWSN